MRPLLGAACLAVLPLAVWPGLERPFSLPKLIWLVAASLALFPVRSVRVSGPMRWLATIWIFGFVVAGLVARLPSLEAMALGLAAPLFAVALTRTDIAAT